MGKVLPAIDQKIDHRPIPGNPKGSGLDQVPECVRSLTHDLRSPLAAVKSCLNLVLREEAGDLTEDQKHFLGLAGRNIDRLDRMVEDMLVSSRARCPELLLRWRDVDLGPLLAESVRLHRLIAAERGIEVDCSGLPLAFRATVDPDLVIRILDNVLGNALKFTPQGGLVRVWLEDGAGSPRGLASRLARHFGLPLATFNLIVEDSGPGLSAAVQNRIFEPFNSGAGDHGRSRTGTGLGLSITRQLAETHGGQVRLASLPGRGTTVWLKLPRDRVSDHLQRSVDQLQKALYEGPEQGVQPLIGVVDLRKGAARSSTGKPDVENFWENRAQGSPRGWELVPGLWAAAVLDPVNWNRRWALHTAQVGGGLEATRWEFLAPEAGKRRRVTGNPGEQPETMVNQEPRVPIIF